MVIVLKYCTPTAYVNLDQTAVCLEKTLLAIPCKYFGKEMHNLKNIRLGSFAVWYSAKYFVKQMHN